MSKETIKIVEIDTNPAVKSIKDLRKELKEFKDQMANLEEGSDEFLEIANKAGEVKHQLDEINESVKGASSDFGDMVGNISNVTAGLVGAFSAIRGGLQALGLENAAIDESIKQMQGLMAVVQGLGQIDTAIKSLNKLQKSITSTTAAAKLLKAALEPKVFLAISAAIAAATVIFNQFKKKQEEATRAQEEYNKKIAEEKRIRVDAAREQYLKDLDKELRVKLAIAEVKYEDNELEGKREQLKALRTELAKLNIEFEYYKNGNYAVGEDPTVELQKRMEAIKKVLVLIEQTDADIAVLEAVAAEKAKKPKTKTTEEISKEEAEALAKSNEQLDIRLEKLKHNGETEKKNLEETIKIEQERLALYAEGSLEYERIESRIYELKQKSADLDKEITEESLNADLAKAQYELEGKDLLEKQIEIETKRLTLLELESAEYYNQKALIQELQAELTAMNDDTTQTLDQRKEYLRSVADEYLTIEKRELNTQGELDRLKAELDEAKTLGVVTAQEYEQALARMREIYARNVTKEISSTFAATSQLVTGILDGIAEQQDQTNKEGFEKSKKLQIASATIQMLTGIATALAGAFTTKTGPWDIALAAIQAATIAASGALNINKIKNTKFDGGGASVGTSSAAVSATIMPPVQYSNAVQGAQTESAIQNTKVYVTESDIVGTINKVNVQEQENSY